MEHDQKAGTFRFLDLPAEVRVRVYEEFFNHEKATWYPKKLKVSRHLRIYTAKNPYPSLYWVNRQVRREIEPIAWSDRAIMLEYPSRNGFISYNIEGR